MLVVGLCFVVVRVGKVGDGETRVDYVVVGEVVVDVADSVVDAGFDVAKTCFVADEEVGVEDVVDVVTFVVVAVHVSASSLSHVEDSSGG